jgi:signal transduction histidine kinase
MKPLSVKFRVFALGAAVALMGAGIALIILNFQRQERELQSRLTNIDAESGQIASHFKDAVRELNNTRLQYALGRDPAVWRQFERSSAELDHWLDQQAPLLKTDGEKQALDRVKAAYRDYLRTARAVSAPEAGPPRPGELLAAFTRARSESEHLFDLGEDLARAHFRSRDRLIAEARQRLRGLQSSLLVLLGLLFACGTALAAVAYRDLIAPLRLKLVESQGLAERHEKLASLGMLAAGVAHEIRNPLTAIKAALFIQQKRFAPGTAEHADAELVQREISRLEKIVNDFLRFARPGDPELATIPADLLLQEVRTIFTPQLDRSGIRLVLGEPTPWLVRVDPGQIKQVLINLVQNAVDSVGRDGTVTLRARRDRKWVAGAERDVVILEVADTGKGIPPEVGERLFDPFFTTKEEGTGLGLSIAARIVEKHRGSLQYQSQVNLGTTFGIVLPQAAP